MSTGLITAEQARASHIAAMGEELGSVYSDLWQQVAELHLKWSEYVVLFGTKESRVELLNDTIPSFARMVQDSFWEDVLLHIARLTDPPRSAGRRNLSAQTIIPLVSHPDTRARLEAQLADVLTATAFCRDWRNRRIAHRDLNLALERGAEPLQSASRLKVVAALEALAKLLNIVSVHYLDSTTFFEFADGAGKATRLLYMLDLARNAENLRRERIRLGTYDGAEYRPHDL
jgi:hypothetical protein